MGVLAKHFWKNLFGFRDPAPEVMDRKGPGVNLVSTINYPDERKPYPPGYRGTHRLVARVDGRPRCVALLHVRHDLPGAVHLHRGRRVRGSGHREVPGPLRDRRAALHRLFCVEACPKDAIRMDTGTHAPAVLSRPLAVFDKQALLQGPAVKHPSDVVTYRVPLRTPAPREPVGPGVTSKGDARH